MGKYKIQDNYILITSSNFPNGGPSASYLNLFCKGLKLNGCTVRVLLIKGFAFRGYSSLGSKHNTTEYGVPFTFLGFINRPKNIFLKLFDELISISRLVWFLLSIIKQRKNLTLLIYNNDFQFNMPIYLIGSIFNFNLVTFISEYFDSSQHKNMLIRKVRQLSFMLNFKYINKLSDKLIVFSYFLRDKYIGMGFSQSNIYVQPNLTDFDYWFVENSEVKYTLGYSGSPTLNDGLMDLFKAVSILRCKNININLLIIGDSIFGDSLIPSLAENALALGILENVKFTGLVDSDNVKGYLSECKILTITRLSNTQTQAGFPTKLGEYYAAKKAILVTNFGDIGCYFQDGIDIVIAESGNPEAIAHKIEWMLKNDDKIEHISRQGYFKAKELLEYNNSVRKICEFLTL
jgi:glycosyltransferase involved in cell wall biosynthesis